MREKLATLPLVQLKELAKSQGLKGTSTMKKAELIEYTSVKGCMVIRPYGYAI